MKSDVKGVSQCPTGEESCESFTRKGKKYLQYDYRTLSGKLFACAAPSLEECRKKRDKWLQKQNHQ